jgi:hypothetical protein
MKAFTKLRTAALGAAVTALALTTATALGGSGVGGVFNLGQANTVNGTSTLTGTTGGPQLKVTNGSSSNQAITAVAGNGTGIAVFGFHSGTTGTGAAVRGQSASAAAPGILGLNTGGGFGGHFDRLRVEGPSSTVATPRPPAVSVGPYGAFEIDASGAIGAPAVADGRLIVQESGNVGVQTKSPAAALDVETKTNFQGIQGQTTVSQGNGVVGIANVGTASYAVEGSSSQGYAGRFFGKVQVDGNFHATGTCCTKMDDPLDPANKYLYQAAVEAPTGTNIYSGNVTTDQNGYAVVTLPDYAEALNRDFRYQLTIVGKQWAQARIEKEIQNNRFTIRTDKPNVKVSWQVTGTRNDAYAKAHPFVAEQPKPAAERGYYLHPEVYGQPASKGIHWAERQAKRASRDHDATR